MSNNNNPLCKTCQDFLNQLADWQVKFKKVIEDGCERRTDMTCGRGFDFGWKNTNEMCKCRRGGVLCTDAYGDKSKVCNICHNEGITDPSQIVPPPEPDEPDNTGPKCQECSTPLITSAKYEHYSLSKGNNDEKQICLTCWGKKQEQYKQEWDDICKKEKTFPYWPKTNISNITFPHYYIQAKCKMKNCGKKFDCQTAEKDRHKWNRNQELSDDDHEELNKNPAPVKTMEDLVKQWMVSMGYQKIYWDKEERMWKKKKTDGTILERWGVSLPDSWNDKLEKWLEKQPNKSIEVKAERERERERERAKLRNWGNELLN
jgi:hypothetical protein